MLIKLCFLNNLITFIFDYFLYSTSWIFSLQKNALIHLLIESQLPVLETTVDDCNLYSIMNGFSNAIDELRKAVDIQFSKLERRFNRAILDLRQPIDIVEKENNVL